MTVALFARFTKAAVLGVLTAGTMTLMLGACGGEEATPGMSAGTGDSAVTDTSTAPATDQVEPSPATLDAASAEQALRRIYQPIADFYENATEGPGGQMQPPSGMDTPQALMSALTQTMSRQAAETYAAQLLMEQDGAYVVRPTESIVMPQGDGPDLELVTVEAAGEGYLVTEQYAETELYGDFSRTSLLRRAPDGGWVLAELRTR